MVLANPPLFLMLCLLATAGLLLARGWRAADSRSHWRLAIPSDSSRPVVLSDDQRQEPVGCSVVCQMSWLLVLKICRQNSSQVVALWPDGFDDAEWRHLHRHARFSLNPVTDG
ncbi:MAG: hypothetical protein CMK32_06275 [Porticoccaceae bacterium]|nr:hypothetical protein [Porticoccaceae bacterium]